MKLAPRDTDAFLKNPAGQSKAVLIYGPDGGLVRERAKAIIARILGAGFDPLNLVEMGADQLKSDPAILCDELSALSLMGGQRLVVIRDCTDKFADIIASAFEGLNTTTYLIVEATELSPSGDLRQLFEKDSHFAALACYRDEGRNLEEIIRSALGKAGLRVSPDAMHYLSAHLGNDRGVTASELDKIILYMGEEKEVTLKVAIELCGHNSSESIEDICHAVAEGKVQHAHALLAQLLNEGTQPVAIVRSLIKYFQRLDVARANIDAGTSIDQAVTQLRPPVFFKYVPVVKRELTRLNARSLAQLLNLLLRTEKELKSSLLQPGLLTSQALQQAARLAAA